MSQLPPDEILERARQQIAARAEAHPLHRQMPSQHERRWGFVFLGLVATVLFTFLLWPSSTLEVKLFAAVHGLVAQKHLIFIGEQPLPLCARNLGIYSSFALSLGYLWLRGYQRAAALPSRALLFTLGVALLPMILDGINSVLEDTGRNYWYLPRNDLRTISGALFGLAITPFILFVFNRALRAHPEREQSVLTWGDCGGLLLLNSLFVALAYSNWAIFYWPLAWFGVIAILAELFTVFLMVAASLFGYQRRVLHLRQLGQPACLALMFTIAFAAGLAWLRFSTSG